VAPVFHPFPIARRHSQSAEPVLRFFILSLLFTAARAQFRFLVKHAAGRRLCSRPSSRDRAARISFLWISRVALRASISTPCVRVCAAVQARDFPAGARVPRRHTKSSRFIRSTVRFELFAASPLGLRLRRLLPKRRRLWTV
jgi:hypothetical protein